MQTQTKTTKGQGKPELPQGTPVMCNGYRGAIIRQYDGDMYEIRLERGTVCTDDFSVITGTAPGCEGQGNTDTTASGTPEAPQYDSDTYDTEAIEIDRKYGNFSEDQLEDYRHENIVRMSFINGQFSQARKQCASYGLDYQSEKHNFEIES